MYKQAVSSKNNIKNANDIIDELGVVTMEQHAEFAKLSGRFDADFKVGKLSDVILGKSAYFKVGKPSDASAGKY